MIPPEISDNVASLLEGHNNGRAKDDSIGSGKGDDKDGYITNARLVKS